MMLKKLLPYILTVAIFFICTANALAQQAKQQMPVSKLVESYQQAATAEQKKVFLNDLYKAKVETKEDVQQMRKVFSSKKFDGDLFAVVMDRIRTINKPELDEELLAILQDEKGFIEKVAGIKDTEELNKKIKKGELPVSGEREARYRCQNVNYIVRCLGELKSKKAAPILTNLLKYRGTQYYASQSLAQIGDTSAREDLRERAYKGEEINFGGQGLEEAKIVVKDLEDTGKKDKWPKIAKQLMEINQPGAKPELKKLFDQEKDYVRDEAGKAYTKFADISDLNDILQMAQHKDFNIRKAAVNSMMNINSVDFADELINLLQDPDWIVRHHAARALGAKQIKSGVPALEKALNDNELLVRREAFFALYRLTGKQYDYKGKTELEDRMIKRMSTPQKQ